MSSNDERKEIKASLTDMEDWRREFDVTEMSRTFLGSLFASLTIILAVDCTEARVIDTLSPWPLTLIVLSIY